MHKSLTTAVGHACDNDDNDAFDDSAESYLSTDPLDACADGTSDDAWPLDINKDKVITVSGDPWNFAGHIGAMPGDPNWWQRLDLNMDNFITMADAFMYGGKLGQICT